MRFLHNVVPPALYGRGEGFAKLFMRVVSVGQH